METAISTLTNIVRSTCLKEIAQSEVSSFDSGKQDVEEIRNAQALGASAPLFFDKAHDEFLKRLENDFKARFGIHISNVRIESFKIMDNELSGFISRQAISTAETENRLSNLKGQTEIATVEKERDARVQQIQAEQEARALKINTESQNKAQLDKAKANAEALTFKTDQENKALIEKAKADAEAVRLKANAEAEAIRTKAKAEAERAQLLSQTPLGAQLALLSVWSETVEKSNEGVSKVVYCDPSVQMAAGGNPLGLMGLGSLQTDLNRLSTLGTTAPANKA